MAVAAVWYDTKGGGHYEDTVQMSNFQVRREDPMSKEGCGVRLLV